MKKYIFFIALSLTLSPAEGGSKKVQTNKATTPLTYVFRLGHTPSGLTVVEALGNEWYNREWIEKVTETFVRFPMQENNSVLVFVSPQTKISEAITFWKEMRRAINSRERVFLIVSEAEESVATGNRYPAKKIGDVLDFTKKPEPESLNVLHL